MLRSVTFAPLHLLCWRVVSRVSCFYVAFSFVYAQERLVAAMALTPSTVPLSHLLRAFVNRAHEMFQDLCERYAMVIKDSERLAFMNMRALFAWV